MLMSHIVHNVHLSSKSVESSEMCCRLWRKNEERVYSTLVK